MTKRSVVMMRCLVLSTAAATVSSREDLLISTGVTDQFLASLPGASWLTHGDFDADSRSDVAVAFDDGLEILFANGRKQRVVNASSLSVVEACDVDGDNSLDLVASGLAFDGIDWWRNSNENNASRWTRSSLAPTAGLGTIDLDCRLVVANFFENEVSRYVNSTTTIVIGRNLVGVSSIFSADVDGDGFIDVVSGDDNRLVWFEATTTEEESMLLSHIISFEDGGVSDCWATDVDRDSHVDVVHASAASDEIALHINSNGLGTTWKKQIVTASAGSVQRIEVQDISRADYLDIFAANFRDDQIAWYVYSGGEWEMRIVSEVVVEATHLAVVVEENSVYSVGDSIVRRHDLELVPAPTPAPTITPLPTVVPTTSPKPTVVPSPHPTTVPTPLEPRGKKSNRLFCPDDIKTRAGACRSRSIGYLALYAVAFFALVLVLLRVVLRLLYVAMRPYLIRYEPYYLPKIQVAVHKWKKSRLRKCLCCCCPKCCMWPDDEDPLNPSDGVALKPGTRCPVRVVTEVPRSVKRILIVKTGVREVTVL